VLFCFSARRYLKIIILVYWTNKLKKVLRWRINGGILISVVAKQTTFLKKEVK
jgi:hypothetical protein